MEQRDVPGGVTRLTEGIHVYHSINEKFGNADLLLHIYPELCIVIVERGSHVQGSVSHTILCVLDQICSIVEQHFHHLGRAPEGCIEDKRAGAIRQFHADVEVGFARDEELCHLPVVYSRHACGDGKYCIEERCSTMIAASGTFIHFDTVVEKDLCGTCFSVPGSTVECCVLFLVLGIRIVAVGEKEVHKLVVALFCYNEKRLCLLVSLFVLLCTSGEEKILYRGLSNQISVLESRDAGGTSDIHIRSILNKEGHCFLVLRQDSFHQYTSFGLNTAGCLCIDKVIQPCTNFLKNEKVVISFCPPPFHQQFECVVEAVRANEGHRPPRALNTFLQRIKRREAQRNSTVLMERYEGYVPIHMNEMLQFCLEKNVSALDQLPEARESRITRSYSQQRVRLRSSARQLMGDLRKLVTLVANHLSDLSHGANHS
uniref:Uncharacterized protein n=1 Tax=Chromera velia CCMP2878 TaxID=1169474 RepID=A0A0G4GCX3_9ALVE|eukprot:Cvel_21294.t1-p1 / transcript=Cvel_21294.t1 / gene=Cvel_21294 / organism=Chromera_velia_CCMP2878 / gene_product=Serine/threonine-protein phosphatase 6 regulatory, putative / transcript_product=Serine/threonine-protein phosphatase 6 regulatory, putative / location=Cvel_scaffold1983:33470-35256(-) / protein_length=428 / sequence_SO=supercontig / SO=protein_coding / is_pseudo=false